MKLHVLGAAQEVTGSCYLVETNQSRVLVECGLIQGNYEAEQRNRHPFLFDVRQIDAVFLTHAHLDHSGRIPQLIKAGYRGPIYTHQATIDLCSILLRDSGFLNEKEAELARRKKHAGKNKHALTEPLYTAQDAEMAMRYFKALPYDQHMAILPDIEVRYRDAGHILGSASIEMWVSEGNRTTKVVFSGDLGHINAPILKDPAPIDDADLVLLESTYGDRNHRSWEDTWAELGSIFQQTQHHHGNILIPAFAVGRTQELLYVFKQNFQDWHLNEWQIFLDSPMAIEATKVYARYAHLHDDDCSQDAFDLPNLTNCSSPEQSMMLNNIRSGAIIIAGSGMCNGGRIRHHIQHHINYRQNQMIIVGFQAQGTLGRQLVDGTKTIRLWGEEIAVQAKVHTIGGLSAHADQDGLLSWCRHIKGNPTIGLIHGEPTAITPLANRLKADLGLRIIVPNRKDVIDLATLRLHSTTHH